MKLLKTQHETYLCIVCGNNWSVYLLLLLLFNFWERLSLGSIRPLWVPKGPFLDEFYSSLNHQTDNEPIWVQGQSLLPFPAFPLWFFPLDTSRVPDLRVSLNSRDGSKVIHKRFLIASYRGTEVASGLTAWSSVPIWNRFHATLALSHLMRKIGTGVEKSVSELTRSANRFKWCFALMEIFRFRVWNWICFQQTLISTICQTYLLLIDFLVIFFFSFLWQDSPN